MPACRPPPSSSVQPRQQQPGLPWPCMVQHAHAGRSPAGIRAPMHPCPPFASSSQSGRLITPCCMPNACTTTPLATSYVSRPGTAPSTPTWTQDAVAGRVWSIRAHSLRLQPSALSGMCHAMRCKLQPAHSPTCSNVGCSTYVGATLYQPDSRPSIGQMTPALQQ
jgi:hypothetical protein